MGWGAYAYEVGWGIDVVDIAVVGVNVVGTYEVGWGTYAVGWGIDVVGTYEVGTYEVGIDVVDIDVVGVNVVGVNVVGTSVVGTYAYEVGILVGVKTGCDAMLVRWTNATVPSIIPNRQTPHRVISWFGLIS